MVDGRSRQLWLGVYLPLLVSLLLAIAVVRHPDGVFWDVPILLAIHQTVNPFLDRFAFILTKLGIYWGVAPLLMGLALFLRLSKQWRSLRYVMVTTLGTILISYSMKLAFQRPRPRLWESFYPLPSDTSFPSGHALSSMLVLVILAVLTWETRWRWAVLLLVGLFVLGIGWTRLYLGVHYPSDILAGWMLALSWGIGVKLLTEKEC
jgi:undecaprenyl-diphosphatase